MNLNLWAVLIYNAIKNALDKRGMKMPYNLDLSALSVPQYKELLKQQNLLPGRRMLLQDIDHNFDVIGKQGIVNMAHLKKQLSAPKRLASFAATTGISEEYLVLLKREIGSLEQKPVPIASFPGMDRAEVARLKSMSITTSKDYYEGAPSVSDELSCLCDLVRINGVGAVAAKVFYEAGYRSVAEIACADAGVMLERVSEVNDEKHYYKARLGVKDMQFCIDFAALLMKYCG
jgi:hypothetical protein